MMRTARIVVRTIFSLHRMAMTVSQSRRIILLVSSMEGKVALGKGGMGRMGRMGREALIRINSMEEEEEEEEDKVAMGLDRTDRISNLDRTNNLDRISRISSTGKVATT